MKFKKICIFISVLLPILLTYADEVDERTLNAVGKKIASNLQKKPSVESIYYKSGNIKSKTIFIKNVLSEPRQGRSNPKPSLEIFRQYYDNENALKSKIRFSVIGSPIFELILSNEGKEKCSLEYEGFDENVYHNFFTVNKRKKDIEFIDFSTKRKVMNTAVTMYQLLLPMPYKKTIKCNYDDLYFSFTIKGEGLGKSASLESSYMKIGGDIHEVNTLEEAQNLINKYYIPDVSLKDNLKNYKNKIIDLFD